MTQTIRIMLPIGALLLAFAMGALLFSGGSHPEPHAEMAGEQTAWTCSMHPQIRSAEPGACPICGMDLIGATPKGGSSRTDRVVLSQRARTLARLRTTTVRRQGNASADVRLLGRIEPDETTRKNVTTWVAGRIDRLHVNTTGEQVKAGQVVATLYSPEVYSAHQDLLIARGQTERLSGSTEPTRRAAAAALGAARERLRLLGVPEHELARMEEAEQPTQSVAIRTPFPGTVIERVATEGAYLQTGASLYRVADLDRLWVQLDAYESDLPRLSVGQRVHIVVQGIAETSEGEVAFIDPTVDPQRRTARVRVALRNPDGRLRPGMFAEAVVSATRGEASTAPLVIPASAALFTGKRSIVYVEVEDAQQLAYEPRTVRLGTRLGEVYPVVAGLSEGDRVVSRGAFAIDADLQIRGGRSMMTGPDDRDASIWDSVVELSPADLDQLGPVVHRYLEVQTALAGDDHGGATTGAEALAQAVSATALGGEGAAAWDELADALRSHSRHVSMSHDLDGARAGFVPLSTAIEAMLRRFGNPIDSSLRVAFCPMAQENAGATWVQLGETVANAYFGASMHTCGEIRSVIAPGAHLAGEPRERSSPRAAPAGHVH